MLSTEDIKNLTEFQKTVFVIQESFDKGMEKLNEDVEEISEKAWEKNMITLKLPGGEWEDTISGIAWGFLFDAIHHRGQLSTYLRAMGAKVPSIYGPSADTK